MPSNADGMTWKFACAVYASMMNRSGLVLLMTVYAGYPGTLMTTDVGTTCGAMAACSATRCKMTEIDAALAPDCRRWSSRCSAHIDSVPEEVTKSTLLTWGCAVMLLSRGAVAEAVVASLLAWASLTKVLFAAATVVLLKLW